MVVSSLIIQLLLLSVLVALPVNEVELAAGTEKFHAVEAKSNCKLVLVVVVSTLALYVPYLDEYTLSAA